jgi:phospholipase/carboxylesterase
MDTFDYQVLGNTKTPSSLIIFLHGYTSCSGDIYPFAEILAKKLPQAVVIVPEAKMISERNPQKKQWYPLLDVDPERKRRKPETSVTEIINIYNRTGERIRSISQQINRFITHLQKKFGIKNKNTYLMGFSQGAMIATYTGLSRRYTLGGVFQISGLISGEKTLENELKARPNVYLFHGTDDDFVQYKTLEFTKNWLDNHQVYWEALEYDALNHKLTEEEMDDAAEIITRLSA